MNVSLTPELEAFVHERVKTGRYLSASEVVREALRMLEDQERLRDWKLEQLRKDIQVGIDEAERGELKDGKTFFRELRRKLNKKSKKTA